MIDDCALCEKFRAIPPLYDL